MRVPAPVARSRTGSVFAHPWWRGGVGAGTQNPCGNRCGLPICRLGCSRCGRGGAVTSSRAGLVVGSRTGSAFPHGLWRGGAGAGTQNGCGNCGVRRGFDGPSSGALRRSAAGFRRSSSRHVMSRGAIPGWVVRAPSGGSLRPNSEGNFRYLPSGSDSLTGRAATMITAGRPGPDECCRGVAKGDMPPRYRADVSAVRCEVSAVAPSKVRAHMSVKGMVCVPRSAAEPTRPA